MMLRACEEIREDGLSNLRLHAFVGHSALPQYSAWTSRAAHLSNIEYGHLTTPQLYAFGQSSQNYDVDMTDAITSLTSNFVISGYHNNYLDTSQNFSTLLSSAGARQQQALTHYSSRMNQNRDYSMQIFPNELKDVAQTASSGLVEPPACHEFQCGHLPQKSTLVQWPANLSVLKSDEDAFSIASPILKKLSSRNGKPKRALTAYNIFFKEAREQMLAERQVTNKDGKVGKGVRNCDAERRPKVSFEEMGKIIGRRWKELDKSIRRRYEERAKAEKRRYRDELSAYMLKERKKVEVKFAALQASLSEETKQQYFARRK